MQLHSLASKPPLFPELHMIGDHIYGANRRPDLPKSDVVFGGSGLLLVSADGKGGSAYAPCPAPRTPVTLLVQGHQGQPGELDIFILFPMPSEHLNISLNYNNTTWPAP